MRIGMSQMGRFGFRYLPSCLPHQSRLYDMFDREIHEKLDSIAHDVLTLREIIMAQFSDLQAAQAVTATALQNLATRVAAAVGATPAQLDTAVAAEQANSTAADAIDPAAVVTPPAVS
jgi:hypothetical protein